jgi:hypothetical protein
VGTINDDGFVLSGTFQGQEVNASDAYGMTLVEAIWRGLNWRMRFRGLEFNKPGILLALQTFGSTGASTTTFTPTLADIGDRWSNYSYALVLTAILGNPPTMPQTLTAPYATIAPQFTTEFFMTSKVREAPIEMVLLPSKMTVGSLSNQVVSFTTT